MGWPKIKCEELFKKLKNGLKTILCTLPSCQNVNFCPSKSTAEMGTLLLINDYDSMHDPSRIGVTNCFLNDNTFFNEEVFRSSHPNTVGN